MPDAVSAIFQKYIAALRETPIAEQTEHSSRAALKDLLDAFRPAKAIVTHEPKRAQAKGAPDFKISQAGQILGYVENKAVGENLDAVLKSAQIKKYQTLSGNIIVSDYLRFIWLKDGKVIDDVTLARPNILDDRKANLRDADIADVERLLKAFFSVAPEGIARAKVLAEALASRSQLLRDYLGEELVRQQEAKEGGQLIGLFGAFAKQVSHEITLAEFADAFAQTLAYGLFLAKLNDREEESPSPSGEGLGWGVSASPNLGQSSDGQSPPPTPPLKGRGATITLTNAKTFIPQSVGLIRELVGFLDNLDEARYADIRWVVEEVLSIINGLKLAELQEDLSFRNRKAKRGTSTKSDEEWRLFSRDPFIYFYEDYLAKYDGKLRKSRGVYYTPPPIVNFIVRAIHDILKDTFGIAQGLADRNRVTVLDFACGTGTFLVEVLERIFEEIGPDSGKADKLVAEHILKNIFGFEYLIAPYTIAHLKLGQYLAEKGHKLSGDQRFQVYLTNTLEPIAAEPNFLVPELSKETERAQAVKEQPILVITGNPPYSGHSKNNGVYAKASVAAYKIGPKEIDKPRQGKWLQNDYVKFIRFAQAKMDNVEEGIVAVITANSFLDGQTYTFMRHSLSESFDQIHLIDLHGNTDRLETTPEGQPDQNVFDISTGVSMAILVKKSGLKKGIFHADWWGKRQEKYEKAFESGLGNSGLEPLSPRAPQFLFVPHKEAPDSEFNKWWSVADIFSPSGKAAPGFVTLHDDFAISFEREESISKVDQLVASETEADAREGFKLCKQEQWSYKTAKEALAQGGFENRATKVNYRPFDDRWTIWDTNVAVHLRLRANGHLLNENVALLTTRATKGEDFGHALVTERPTEAISLSSKTSNNAYVFPLYLYPPAAGARKARAMDDLYGEADPFAGKPRIENIAPAFRAWIDGRYGVEKPLPFWGGVEPPPITLGGGGVGAVRQAQRPDDSPHPNPVEPLGSVRGTDPSTPEGEGLKDLSPETILGYIYAVLHAPTYRAKYADFLRTDFPRIPFPERHEDFAALSKLGWALIQAHLMKAVPERGLGAYQGKGADDVVKPRYSPQEQCVWINETKRFTKVPERVWNFTIGGYQVIDKYLKSRKARTLSLAEIENVENIVNVLDYTIETMAAIDAAYATAGL